MLSSLTALIVTVAFLRVWQPAVDPAFALSVRPDAQQRASRTVAPWQGWTPWVIVSVVVIVWTHFKVNATGARLIPWPGLDRAIGITLYHGKPYAALYRFEPLASGTAILVAALITASLVGVRPAGLARAAVATWRQAQNIATGVSGTDLKGQEGVVFARTFKHSIILTALLGGLVLLQQYVLTWIIPK